MDLNTQQQDEQHLVAYAQQHPDGFAQLYDRYVDRIFAYIRRETVDKATAEDIVAATFIKAYQNLSRYEWRGASFGAWLYKIARNELRMQARKEKWTQPLFGLFFRSSHNVEHEYQQKEALDAVQLALRQLSHRDQEILQLCYYEDLSHTDVGEILGCSAKNVAVRLHRALKRLRQQIAVQESKEVLIDVLTD